MCDSTGGGVNTGMEKSPKTSLKMQRGLCLDACPVDVIQRFFNCSWRFMDVYWQGLTGRAAEWAVQKQKSHQRVGAHTIMSIDAIVNWVWYCTVVRKSDPKVGHPQNLCGKVHKVCNCTFSDILNTTMNFMCHKVSYFRDNQFCRVWLSGTVALP